ncbi:AAA family ATPase [Myxococcota bacterium]|nr:AAA family ATPase [Myxococcota bacterium]
MTADPAPLQADPEGGADDPRLRALSERASRLARALGASAPRPGPLVPVPLAAAMPEPLRRLAGRLGLDPLEGEVLRLVASADLDPRAGPAWVAWRGGGSPRPSTHDLVAFLAPVSPPEAVLVRLAPGGRLRRSGVLAGPEPSSPGTGAPLLAEPLRAADAAVAAVLGWTAVDRSLAGKASVAEGAEGGIAVRPAALLTDPEAPDRALRIARDSALLGLPVTVEGEDGRPFARLPVPVTAEAVLDACRRASRADAGPLARRVHPRLGWDDLVVSEAACRQLRALCAVHEHRGRVLDGWGFGRRGRGRGARGLFCGPPGTGKTLAAEVVAHQLGMDLLHVDVSQCVSKWLGETEKNLSRAFEAAEAIPAVLFFDEADALFGERTRAASAQDRYANLEVAFLLQRIEASDAVVLLATNLRRNLDDAFVRRLHQVVEFPSPDAMLRARLWRRELPPEAPFDPDVDPEDLGRRFPLAGGSIRNAALKAAFGAAAEDRAITRRDLFAAVAAEVRAGGRVPDRAAFAPFDDLLDDVRPEGV